MQTQWCLVDRSRSKRSNEESIDICSKRQRRVPSQLESSDECEDGPQIRGGLARPRPPRLGPPPNRAAKAASQTPPTGPSRPPPTTGSKMRILDSDDDDDDDDWRPQTTAPANKNQTATTVKVGDTKGASTTTGQPPVLTGTKGTSNPQNQPVKVGNTTTPPDAVPTNQKQTAGTGTGTGIDTGTTRPGGTSSTTTTTTTTTTTIPVTLPPFPQESEILRLYTQLQNMVVTWVEECLPDTFPQRFQTERPERYWELCGWCEPLTLGDTMLQDRSWAKYVFESWVWRFFHQEIFQPQSLTWAGNDKSTEIGGAGGAGKTTNDAFESLFDSNKTKLTTGSYESRIRNRAVLMQQLRNSRVSHPQLYNEKTGWLVTEMLTAFYPYFSDVYKPIDQPENIASLLIDTNTLIKKARELDEKLRSAQNVYDLILGKTDAVCDISDVPSPAIQRYVVDGGSRDPDYLYDPSLISLIVVPGLLRFGIEDSVYEADDTLTKTVVRHAKALASADILAALAT